MTRQHYLLHRSINRIKNVSKFYCPIILFINRSHNANGNIFFKWNLSEPYTPICQELQNVTNYYYLAKWIYLVQFIFHFHSSWCFLACIVFQPSNWKWSTQKNVFHPKIYISRSVYTVGKFREAKCLDTEFKQGAED